MPTKLNSKPVIVNPIRAKKNYAPSDNAFSFVFSDDITKWYGRQTNVAGKLRREEQ